MYLNIKLRFIKFTFIKRALKMVAYNKSKCKIQPWTIISNLFPRKMFSSKKKAANFESFFYFVSVGMFFWVKIVNF